ncbi:MAG: ABC transporter ATP-binding protein [Saprospiraceae bacterium]|nr:ABC transporter ATP-binding protein [Saprospiraceae bacterium]MCF8249172.1 ABC transporter ATP-binding protein [Saprospiraceae bacterium]MCF8278886.1 ABC transporter ATP-binding protein [Bacteroidales bacterium]MCF8311301.1 ABC transporter ATP-binding protein [Saprospiraceae bacterium]MCF8440135.1 ABC transporter ATP-binding protein [Saprospiraceae bacterium]
MISIQQLHKSFGTNKVLRGIDLEFDQPGITAVLGPNGSGKTTIIKSILGMVLPDSGTISVQGENISGKWRYRNQIAYLPQIARFPENLTVAELIRMVKDLNTSTAQDEAIISLFELRPFLDKRLGNLSGGTRQKVNLVLTFMYDCPIIFLDEPTAGLDPISMVRLKELIHQQRLLGKTILITTHVMSLVEELAEEVVFLLEGQIHFRGSLKELKEKSEETNVERAIAKLLEKQITEMSA